MTPSNRYCKFIGGPKDGADILISEPHPPVIIFPGPSQDLVELSIDVDKSCAEMKFMHVYSLVSRDIYRYKGCDEV